MSLRIDACVAQHQGDRKEQQDRVAIVPHSRARGVVLAIVADGMGGHTGGVLAAEQVVHTARNNLEHFSPADETARYLLENSMREAHTMIKASRFMNEKDPHSTAVMLLLQPGCISWGYCGDSRMYRFHNEKMVFRTTDHSYVEHLVATGKITPEAALTHPNRNILLTSLGGREEPRFDFGEARDLAGGDSFMLCSDGLWSNVTSSDIAGALDMDAAAACRKLVDLALEHGGDDNATAMVIHVREAGQRLETPQGWRRLFS